MRRKKSDYYEARGFSTYYLCNTVFNVVADSGSYIRQIEDVLGDARTADLMRPFKRYSNLHDFIHFIVTDIIEGEANNLDGDVAFVRAFLNAFQVPFPEWVLGDENFFYGFTAESERYREALDELTDEVFHILFNDIGFLQTFNRLCAAYISDDALGSEHARQDGTLKRVSVPAWARRAVFHRDKGECRTCKRSLTSIVNQLDRRCYDHIVPLALHGANDVTNLQLLCEPCNLQKLAKDLPASRLYQRAIKGE